MGAIEFNELLIENVDFLKPFAFSLTRDNESAKDLTQETIFRALSNRDKYHSGTNLKAWMYTIMRNIFINNYRKKSRQQTTFDNTPNDFLLDYNQTTVSNIAVSNIQMKEIETAIHHLPAIFRNPFVLYCEGYKYNEIAGYMQEPLGTIKSRIHFARKLLKAKIAQY